MTIRTSRLLPTCFGLAALLAVWVSCGGRSARDDNASPATTQVAASTPTGTALPIVGTVTALGPGETFTLQTSRGTVHRFRLDATTRSFTRSMWSAAGTPGDLQIGARLCVSAVEAPDGTSLARHLLRLDPTSQTKAPRSIRPAEGEGPVARIYHHAIYRDRSDEMFIFAGQDGPSWTNEVRDLWSFHVRTGHWEYLGEQPAATANLYVPAYDRDADRIVMYVAMDGDGNLLATPETWAFDPVSRTWENRQAANPPSPRWGSMMAYDAHAGKTVLFGGGDFQTWLPLDETWTYDYPTNTWTQLHPATSPLSINFGAMAYDSRAELIVMFSGSYWYNETGAGWNLDETWTLDVPEATWRRVPTAVAPTARTYHRMDYDPRLGEVLMFGGCTGTDFPDDPLIPQNDTWAFNARTGLWRQLDPKAVPGPTGWHTLVFATVADRAVVFGGGVSRDLPTRATWLYHPEPDRWKNVLE